MIQLEQHQRDAVNRLQNGNILCGGTGAGKSLTALAYYITRVCNGRINAVDQIPYIELIKPVDLYIITTARKRDTFEWEEEMTKFLLYPVNKEWNIKVTIDSWNNIKKYVGVRDAFFIFDEQRVVGSGTWVRSFIKITKFNQWILLSATPGDTWEDYIPVFIANGFYKNRSEFKERHCVQVQKRSGGPNGHKYNQTIRYLETKRLNRLRSQILLIMNYTKKTHQHKEFVKVEYDRHRFKDVMKRRWNDEKEQPIQNISELCYYIRKIVNSDNSRIKAIEEIIRSGHSRLIIFYNFNYELDQLREFAQKQELEYAEWNGHIHEELPTSDDWLYFVQYTAGAEGWNCITTNTIVFYSLNYSYKTTVQAAGRIDRMNTPYNDLYYFFLVSSSPIDLGIRRALSDKKKFNEKSFIKGF